MTTKTHSEMTASSTTTMVLAWLVVGAPLAWGVAMSAVKALALFK